MASQVFKALAAVTVTGAGTALDLGLPLPIHTMQIVHTGAPSAVVVDLEGSLDGTNFFAVATWDSAARSNKDFVTASAFTATISSIDSRAYPVVKYVRANLRTLTAGTSPTVTAMIASYGAT